MLRLATILCAALCLLVPAAGPLQAQPSDLVLILDASGSMWGQVKGEHKIVIARRVLKDVLGRLPANTEVGLVAYGHRREGDCADIETVAPIGSADKTALSAQIDALNPKGKTPITDAVREAIKGVQARDRAATVILVSDGLETCGGDPCAAVREAKAAGVDFVMHVVGFDVGGEDVSQLECAAQAGGGLYLGADDADGLAAALDQAVAVPADLPAGRLSVKVIADGSPVDAGVRVFDQSGNEVAFGRTYTGPDTNPRILPLAGGTYEVVVGAISIRGEPEQRFSVSIGEEALVERTVDFSTGELAILITRNGNLSDATTRFYRAGTNEQVAAGRTYVSPESNPRVVRLTAGTYDVLVGSVEMKGAEDIRMEGIEVKGGERVERSHDFKSGLLRIGAVRGGTLIDATVNVYAGGGGGNVAGGRTYTSATSNPKEFILPPGVYRVVVKPVRTEGTPQEFEVTVAAEGTTERNANFGQ